MERILVLFGTFLSLTSGKKHFGKCPEIDLPAMDMNKWDLEGRWYEIERIPNNGEHKLRKCIFMDFYSEKDEGLKVGVNSAFPSDYQLKVNKTGFDGHKYQTIYGKIWQPYVQEPSVMAHFDMGPYDSFHFPYNLYLFDKKKFALMYACTSTLGMGGEFAWMWSRERTLSTDVRDAFKKMLSGYGVDSNMFETIDQSNCPVPSPK